MVNHFVLRALKEAAEASGLAWPCAENFTNQESGAVDKAGLMHAYAQVAYKLGLTSIHSTDCDYQLSKNYKHKDLVRGKGGCRGCNALGRVCYAGKTTDVAQAVECENAKPRIAEFGAGGACFASSTVCTAILSPTLMT